MPGCHRKERLLVWAARGAGLGRWGGSWGLDGKRGKGEIEVVFEGEMAAEVGARVGDLLFFFFPTSRLWLINENVHAYMCEQLQQFLEQCVHEHLNPHTVCVCVCVCLCVCASALRQPIVLAMLWPCPFSLPFCGISWCSRNTNKECVLKKCNEKNPQKKPPYPHNPWYSSFVCPGFPAELPWH